MQAVTEASPRVLLLAEAEQAVPVGLTRTATVSLPCSVGLERKALL